MHLLGQQTWINLPLYMYELILDEAWSTHSHSLSYSVFLTEFLNDQGVVIGDQETHKVVMSALNKATMSSSKGQEEALTRPFACRATTALEMKQEGTTVSTPLSRSL